MSTWLAITGWWRDVRRTIRGALEKSLPAIERVYTERKRHAAALLALGDKVKDFDTADYAVLEYVTLAIRVAEFALPKAGIGGEKLAVVAEEARKAWGKLARADDLYDAWWDGIARPYIAAYVEESNRQGWVAP